MPQGRLLHHLVTALLLVAAGLWPATGRGQETTPDLAHLLSAGVWVDFNGGLRNLDMTTVAVDPQRQGRLYAAGQVYVYRSLDGGESWDVVFTLAQQGRSEPEAAPRTIQPSDVEDLTDEQLDRVEDRLEELEDDLRDELLQEMSEDLAEEVIDEQHDDLLEQAMLEVLTQDAATQQESFDPLAEPSTLGLNRFTHLLIDPHDSRQVYAASGQGVVVSHDFGADWEPFYRGVGADERRVNAIAVTDETVLVATGSGIQRRAAGDEAFLSVPGPPATAAVRFIVAAPSQANRLYAISEGRILRSDDVGTSWLPLAVPAGLSSADFSNLAVDPNDPDHVYAGTINGVLESDDAGASFHPLGTLGMRDTRVTWVALGSHVIAVGTPDGFYASTDGGQTWLERSDGLSAAAIRQVAVTADGHLWVATNAGLFQLLTEAELTRNDAIVREVQARWASEPNLGETVEAALAAYGYLHLPVEDWARRLFWSRFMPRATLRYTDLRYRVDQRTYIPGPGGYPRLETTHYQPQTRQEWRFYVWWDVPTVVFDPVELSQRDTTDRLTRRRRDLIRRVVRLFQSRRSLMLRMAGARRATVARQVTDRLRLDELTARLDLLTGNAFSHPPRDGGAGP
jgi:photosystem II stability/assembly factor-like uncharacterized protein